MLVQNVIPILILCSSFKKGIEKYPGASCKIAVAQSIDEARMLL
jgi:hypothetical protein